MVVIGKTTKNNGIYNVFGLWNPRVEMVDFTLKRYCSTLLFFWGVGDFDVFLKDNPQNNGTLYRRLGWLFRWLDKKVPKLFATWQFLW